MPDVICLQTLDAIDSRDAILVAVRTGKLNDRELHLDLMGDTARALLLMIIVHYKRGMNNSRDPAEQRQQNA